jgi:uncharacterized membrane protein
MKKFGIRSVVAIGIGTALYIVLSLVSIPLGFIPNTAIQPRAALLALIAAIFGPIVGVAVGFLGHALSDAFQYGSVWWSWVFPDAIRSENRTFKRYTNYSQYQKADEGWYYNLTKRVVMIKYKNPKQDYTLDISYEAFDMIKI